MFNTKIYNLIILFLAMFLVIIIIKLKKFYKILFFNRQSYNNTNLSNTIEPLNNRDSLDNKIQDEESNEQLDELPTYSEVFSNK